MLLLRTFLSQNYVTLTASMTSIVQLISMSLSWAVFWTSMLKKKLSSQEKIITLNGGLHTVNKQKQWEERLRDCIRRILIAQILNDCTEKHQREHPQSLYPQEITSTKQGYKIVQVMLKRLIPSLISCSIKKKLVLLHLLALQILRVLTTLHSSLNQRSTTYTAAFI